MENSKKKVFQIVVGVISIVFAILCFVLQPDLYEGSIVSDQYYGGDAYTGIQHAAAATARNVYYLNQNITELSKVIMMAFGFLFIIVGISSIFKGVLTGCNKNKEKVVETNIENPVA